MLPCTANRGLCFSIVVSNPLFAPMNDLLIPLLQMWKLRHGGVKGLVANPWRVRVEWGLTPGWAGSGPRSRAGHQVSVQGLWTPGMEFMGLACSLQGLQGEAPLGISMVVPGQTHLSPNPGPVPVSSC